MDDAIGMLVRQGENMRQSMKNQQEWIKKFDTDQKKNQELLQTLSRDVQRLKAGQRKSAMGKEPSGTSAPTSPRSKPNPTASRTLKQVVPEQKQASPSNVPPEFMPMPGDADNESVNTSLTPISPRSPYTSNNTELQYAIHEHTEQLAQGKEQIEAIKTGQEKLEKMVTKLSDAVDKLTQKVNRPKSPTISKNDDDLYSKIFKISENISALTKDVNDLCDKPAQVVGGQNDELIFERMANMAKKISSGEKGLEKIAKQFESLKKDKDKDPSGASEVKEQITDFVKKVSEMETRITIQFEEMESKLKKEQQSTTKAHTHLSSVCFLRRNYVSKQKYFMEFCFCFV